MYEADAINLQCGAKAAFADMSAVCRVACLAWAWWIGELMRLSLWPERQRYSLETLSAKEDKKRRDCSGNHLGCPLWGVGGIAVRTKWQSGTAYW